MLTLTSHALNSGCSSTDALSTSAVPGSVELATGKTKIVRALATIISGGAVPGTGSRLSLDGCSF